MATRLLIIHRQLAFAVTIKQALEQTGGFAVHPFTKAEAAFDFLRDHPQDIALVDFKLPGRSGPKIVQQLRVLQKDISVVVTPKLNDAEVRNLAVQGVIDSPFAARDLIPVLMNALDVVLPENVLDDLPEESINPMSAQMTTQNLGDDKRIRRKQLGTTQNLGNDRDSGVQNLPETNILPPQPHEEKPNDDKEEVELPSSPFYEADKPQTRKLPPLPKLAEKPFVEAAPPPPETRAEPAGMRILPDEFPEFPGGVQDFRTRQLPDEPSTPPRKETRQLPNIPPVSSNKQDLQTRQLTNEPIEKPRKQTRKLPTIPQSPADEDDFLQERQLNAKSGTGSDIGQTRDLGTRELDPGSTRDLGRGNEEPSSPPEFSSLDSVLQSFGFEPPPDEQDTPAVPTKDSDALRQFLATTGNTDTANSFDDVLGSIDPSNFDIPKQQRQVDFEGLVKSMKSSEPERRLPDRQQQLMDFILTSGMDSILREIEKTKTGLMPKVTLSEIDDINVPPPVLPEEPAESSSFQKLAQEEPPMPTLEENGTVSDLLVGISDSNFRDVLELLKDYDDPEPAKQKAKTPVILPRVEETDFSQDFATGRDEGEVDAVLPPTNERSERSFDFDFESEFESEATVAQVVLNATEERSSTPGDFSLDQLLTDINDRLNAHKLRIRPLPSWDMDTTAFQAVVNEPPPEQKQSSPKSYIEEPGFLPEDFSTGEIVPPELPPLEAEVSEVWTTRASEATLEEIDASPWDGETMLEPGFVDETIASSPVTADVDIGGIIEGASEDIAQEAEEAEYVEENITWDATQSAPDLAETETTAEIEFWDDEAASIGQSDDVAAPVFIDEDIPYEEGVSTDELAGIDESPTAENEYVPTDSWDDVEGSVVEEFEAESEPAMQSEEAYLAQMALNLTQVSLELSAEGTILTRDNEVIALAGHLANEDVLELRDLIHNDWGTGGQGSRLRFINLPSSGKDYMLYSTATDSELTLSMIFAGTTPLRIIRQQGQRLSKALVSGPEQQTPEPPPVVETKVQSQPTETPAANLELHSFVWLVRDPNRALNRSLTQSISAGLSTQLRELQWKVNELQVREDYVYLLAEVPDDKSSNTLIRELKQRSAEIAFQQDNSLTPQMLWADSYLILSPGREMLPEEIQEFIDFQRMM
ncbi:MAG: transposase [Anaerolineae bacterium]